MNNIDLEQSLSKKPYRTIWHLAWPQVLMMIFHFLIGFVDVWVAGQIGREVQACMGMLTQALFFFLVVATALANGSVAAISQSMGAGLYKRIQRYVGLGLMLGISLGICILILGYGIKGAFLEILHVPTEIHHIAQYLLEIYLYILPAYYILILCNAFFRAQKRVMYPLYSMIIVTSLNTFGDLAFGLGWFGFPAWGYKGLAWATFLSILGGALFSLYMLLRKKMLAKASFAPWKWNKAALPYLFKVAWPAGSMQIAWHSAYMVLYAIVGSLPLGSINALAGMSAGIRVEALLFLPGFAFNLTSAILVGHYLGAGKPQEAKKIGYQIMFMGLISISIVTALLWLAIEPITTFLAPEPAVQAVAMDYLKYNMAAIPFILIVMILGGALTGAGATLYQMGITGTSSWLIRLPLAWWMGHILFGTATGIWISMLISQIIQAGLMLYFYHFRPWHKFAMKSRKQRK